MIYVIGEARTGVVKIGTARDPRKRLAALQTGNPRDLRVLATFEGGSTGGAPPAPGVRGAPHVGRVVRLRRG